jgi:hypothetical protein
MGLSYFLKCVRRPRVRADLACYRLTGYSCVLLNPEFSGSPVLKEFVFS